jgi:hypothetical protein
LFPKKISRKCVNFCNSRVWIGVQKRLKRFLCSYLTDTSASKCKKLPSVFFYKDLTMNNY